jgi:hypothetical protein
MMRGSDVTKEEFNDILWYFHKGYEPRTIFHLTGRNERTIERCIKAKSWKVYLLLKQIHALKHQLYINGLTPGRA